MCSVSLLGQTGSSSALRLQNSGATGLWTLGCGLVLGPQISGLRLRLTQVTSLVCAFQTLTEPNYQYYRASTLHEPCCGNTQPHWPLPLRAVGPEELNLDDKAC